MNWDCSIFKDREIKLKEPKTLIIRMVDGRDLKKFKLLLLLNSCWQFNQTLITHFSLKSMICFVHSKISIKTNFLLSNKISQFTYTYFQFKWNFQVEKNQKPGFIANFINDGNYYWKNEWKQDKCI